MSGSHPFSVLEFGSLDINGSVRSVCQDKTDYYLGVDIVHGPGVDVVGDASIFGDVRQYDVVICCEVFEHTPKWPIIVNNAYDNLVQGGLFVTTMAGIGRAPHSAFDERPIRDFEYYQNISEDELSSCLGKFSFMETNTLGNDTRGRAIK